MPLFRADHQQLQALSARQLGADADGVGRWTTARSASASSATANPSASRTECPARTPIRTSRLPPCSAAGLAGVEERLDCGDEYLGNAYVDPKLARLPASLRDAADLFHSSKLARAAFGDEVVDFYVHHARLEVEAFNNAVTDWEKKPLFRADLAALARTRAGAGRSGEMGGCPPPCTAVTPYQGR